MKRVPCNLCNSSRSQKYLTKAGFTLVKCVKCDLVYVDPRLDDKEIKNIYDKKSYFVGEYRGYGFDYEECNYLRALQEPTKEIKFEYSRILDLIEPYTSSFFTQGTRKLLDVGAGVGILTEFAQRRGYEAWGLEPSHYAVSIAQKRGLRVIRGDLSTRSLPEASFDVIVMHDVVEHLLDPKTDVTKAYTLLRTGGLFFVETGNISSLKARICGKKSSFIWPEGHLYYFTTRSLKKLLFLAGFQWTKIWTSPPCYCWYSNSRIFRRMVKYGLLKATRPSNNSTPDTLTTSLTERIAFQIFRLYFAVKNEGIIAIARR